MTAGEQFVKMLRPVGCGICLLVLLCFLLMSFLSGGGKALDVGDYAPPESLDTADPEALGQEIARSLLPHLPGEGSWYVEKDRLHLVLDGADFAACRKTILHYYPRCGIQFHRRSPL